MVVESRFHVIKGEFLVGREPGKKGLAVLVDVANTELDSIVVKVDGDCAALKAVFCAETDLYRGVLAVFISFSSIVLTNTQIVQGEDKQEFLRGLTSVL